MRIDQLRPAVFQVTLHTYELSALVAGARWATENGGLPSEAREQLEAVLADYDAALADEKEPQVEDD